MKKNIIIALMGTAVVALMFAAGCQKEYRSAPEARFDSDGSRSIYLGDTTSFKFIISPADENAEIEWGISNQDIVKQNPKHSRYVELIGLKAGDLRIWATVKGHPELTDTCDVKVKDFPTLAEKVVLSKVKDTLYEKTSESGYADTLTYALLPDGADKSADEKEISVEWSIEEGSDVVAINQDGVICPLSEGEATVRVTVTSKFRDSKSEVWDECKIVVERLP